MNVTYKFRGFSTYTNKTQRNPEGPHTP